MRVDVEKPEQYSLTEAADLFGRAGLKVRQMEPCA
jgi:hypothetical protein